MVETQRSQKQQRSDDDEATTIQRLHSPPAEDSSAAITADNWWVFEQLSLPFTFRLTIIIAIILCLRPTVRPETRTIFMSVQTSYFIMNSSVPLSSSVKSQPISPSACRCTQTSTSPLVTMSTSSSS